MLRRVLLALFFALAASPALSASIVVVVDIPMQTMHVRIDGETRYRWDVSTGRAGYATPAGRYQPIRMHELWHPASGKCSDAVLAGQGDRLGEHHHPHPRLIRPGR